MTNASIAYSNFVDLAATTLTANAALTSAPVSNLTSPHVGKKWRDNATSTFVQAAFNASKSVDTFMLAGVSGNPDSFRVRGSSGSPDQLGDVFDSGLITGLPYFDSNYGLFVYTLSAPVTVARVRIDIAQAGVSYIEAGRFFAGARTTFTTNSITWSRRIVRSSVDVFGVGGQTFVDLRQGHVVVAAAFNFLTEAERIGFIDAISSVIRNTGHQDLLWLRDTASADLSSDSVWGYIEGDLLVTQSLLGVSPALYSVDLNIRQRL